MTIRACNTNCIGMESPPDQHAANELLEVAKERLEVDATRLSLYQAFEVARDKENQLQLRIRAAWQAENPGVQFAEGQAITDTKEVHDAKEAIKALSLQLEGLTDAEFALWNRESTLRGIALTFRHLRNPVHYQGLPQYLAEICEIL